MSETDSCSTVCAIAADGPAAHHLSQPSKDEKYKAASPSLVDESHSKEIGEILLAVARAPDMRIGMDILVSCLRTSKALHIDSA